MAHSVAASPSAFSESAESWRHRRTILVVLLVLLWAGWTSKVDLRLLFSVHVWRSLADLLARLFPPDMSPEFLKVALRASLATVATGLVATVFSALLALPLGMLASDNLWRAGITRSVANGWSGKFMAALSWLVLQGMGVIRSIPDLVWALLFVAGLGLGPLAGTFALIVSYAALLGRVYSDIFDEADKRPLEALQALGATRWQIFLFGIVPQSRALLISYTLYCFECCMRSAAVLGFVGAGGLGYEINLSMRLFEFPQVLTLIACFILLLFLVDVVSRSLRAQLMNRRAAVETKIARYAWFTGVGLATLFFVCLPASGMTAANLSQNDTLRNFSHFFLSLLNPALSPSFLREVGSLALQTISISLVGTAAGTVLGLLLSLPATRLRTSRYESVIPSRLIRFRAEAIFWSARLLLNLLRAIPELVWVLICVITVGFGPFAGAIALGLHTGGVLGKLFAEAMEDCDQGALEALRALGASPLQAIFWVVLPQSLPMMWRYVLLRWDMNLRAATILGLVGGGGLGQALYNDVQLGFYTHVSTLILAVILLVTGTDWLSRSSAQWEMLTGARI